MRVSKRKGIAQRGAMLLLAAQLLGPGPVVAEETSMVGGETEETYQLETVTVTAEKRPVALQDVPASVTSVTSDQIDDAGIETITEVANQVPNLHIFTWGGRRNNHIFMRGVGATYGEPAVGFFVDGVGYTGDGMFDMDLFDVERVEVLRGPQGTLYGRNALAGVINIVTKQPSNETEARASADAGNFGQRELKGSLRIPLVENRLFLGLSASATKRDGYVDNTYLDEKADDRDDRSLRANLRWTPTANFDASLSVDGEHFRGGAYPLGPLQEVRDHSNRVSNDFAGRDDRDSTGASLRLQWDGPGVEITSISGWRDWENDSLGDQDGSDLSIVHVHTQEEQKQLTQELRFASSDDGGPLRWLAGAYYYQKDFVEDTVQMFGTDAVALGFVPAPMDNVLDADKDDSGHALFGQLDYRVTDRVTLTAGLRRDHDEREADVYDRMTMGGVTVPGTESTLREKR
ncbi:TPA: TonB-dependent receptor, partial [Candidatus Micrarchaeota archaeon]|nr:TonB-dependent receptor [Candidatus Micrarchaeota archaeon]